MSKKLEAAAEKISRLKDAVSRQGLTETVSSLCEIAGDLLDLVIEQQQTINRMESALFAKAAADEQPETSSSQETTAAEPKE